MGNLRDLRRYFLCYFVLVSLIALVNRAEAQLVVDTTQSPAQLVQNVLLGSGVSVSNITYMGSLKAIGYFDGTHSNIGLNRGILMTTGSAKLAVGPNNTGGASYVNNEPGDSLLSTLLNDSATYDACILEFDFTPHADTLSFSYVFGSEEYPEFVCCNKNDVFGFFISGPGINGVKNIAVVPGTTIPISINSINGPYNASDPCGSGCSNSNSQYYVDNTGGATVQYDGFTTVMRAVTAVQCGQKYHIKIAIADAGDRKYDSGVFLGGGSFSGGDVGTHIVSTPPVTDTLCLTDNISVYYPDNNPNHIYNWDFGDAEVLSGMGAGPYELKWPDVGMKKITVSVQDSCADYSDSLYMNIQACDVKIPNIITPNGDGKDDKFYITNLDKYPGTRLIIFNRWGKRIYTDNDYQNNWDGHYLASGVYYYVVNLSNGQTKKGFFTLLKN